MNKHYIRFGEIPENETSGIYLSGERIGIEKGVSVYDAVEIDGEWRVVLPNPLLKEVGFDLYNFISNTKHLVETERRPMYLVQGDEVGRGSTNEPLLRNVKIIKEL